MARSYMDGRRTVDNGRGKSPWSQRVGASWLRLLTADTVARVRGERIRSAITTAALISVAALSLSLAGCGGGTDGGWLTTGSGWVMFIDISGGSGTVDYAYTSAGSVQREDGDIVVHNDGTVEIDGMVDGPLDACSTCTYQVQNGDLIINGQYSNYTSGGTSTGTLTFSSGDSSTYESDVQSLGSSG